MTGVVGEGRLALQDEELTTALWAWATIGAQEQRHNLRLCFPQGVALLKGLFFLGRDREGIRTELGVFAPPSPFFKNV